MVFCLEPPKWIKTQIWEILPNSREKYVMKAIRKKILIMRNNSYLKIWMVSISGRPESILQKQ